MIAGYSVCAVLTRPPRSSAWSGHFRTIEASAAAACAASLTTSARLPSVRPQHASERCASTRKSTSLGAPAQARTPVPSARLHQQQPQPASAAQSDPRQRLSKSRIGAFPGSASSTRHQQRRPSFDIASGVSADATVNGIRQAIDLRPAASPVLKSICLRHLRHECRLAFQQHVVKATDSFRWRSVWAQQKRA